MQENNKINFNYRREKNIKKSTKRPNIISYICNIISNMEYTIYFIGGLVMGVVITIVGLKSGAKIYNKAVTDITQPPEFQPEDRTQDIPNYDYNEYDNYYNDLKDDKN